MKAILEFNLPEDKEDYELCNKALAMSSAIDEIKDYLRTEYKYGKDKLDIEEVRDRIHEILKDNEIYI